jgi:hypothetical protein
LLLIATIIVLAAYFLGTKLKKRPGNLLLPYLCGSLIVAFHWTLHPFYKIPEPESDTCKIVGIITVANEQLMRCYEASIFYALWKIYKKRGTNSHEEIRQRQQNFKRINWRFHLLSIAGMIYITVMSLLIEEPGRDYFDLCTLQWDDKSEKGPIMFEGTIYLVFCVYNIFLCCDIWYSQKFPTPEQLNDRPFERLEGLELSCAVRKKTEIEYFQKILKWYLFSTTGVGTVLAGLNFYAAYETSSSSSQSTAIMIIHDFAVIAQPLLVMILKLDEPLVKREVKRLGMKMKKPITKMQKFCSGLLRFCCFCWFPKNKGGKNKLKQSLISEDENVELENDWEDPNHASTM